MDLSKKSKHVDEDTNGGEGVGSSLYEKKWNAAFNRLKIFKAKHGHCRVPNRYPEDPQLGNWVSTQRRQYRILTSGTDDDKAKNVPLTLERAQQLIDLGFEWCAKDPSHKCWEDRFQDLCNFKKRYGTTCVPMGWKENPRLATWVSTQRQEYKQFVAGSSSRLNEAKVKLLDDIGFVWEAQRGRPKSNASNPVELPEAVARKDPPDEEISLPASETTIVRDQSSTGRGSSPKTSSVDFSTGAANQSFTCSSSAAPQLSSQEVTALSNLIQQLSGSTSVPQSVTQALGQLGSATSLLLPSSVPAQSRDATRAKLLAALAVTNTKGAQNEKKGNAPSDAPDARVLACRELSSKAANEPEGEREVLWENRKKEEGMMDGLVQPGKEAGQTPKAGLANGPNRAGKTELPVLAARGSNVTYRAMPSNAAGSGNKRKLGDFLANQESGQVSEPSQTRNFVTLVNGLSSAQSLTIVRLYAASLPATSRARNALLAASSVAEAENILKADILATLLQPTATTSSATLQQAQTEYGNPQQPSITANPDLASLQTLVQAVISGISTAPSNVPAQFGSPQHNVASAARLFDMNQGKERNGALNELLNALTRK